MPLGERQELKALMQNKEIILEKEEKSTTTVVMSKENKIKEGQELLDLDIR